jgi:hypothetical protein
MGKSQKRGGLKKQKQSIAAQYQPKIDATRERKKARLVALVFCMYFSIDQQGRKNLLGCFDRIYADPVTKQTGQFILVVRTMETRSGELVASILDPNNQSIAAIIFEAPSIEVPPDMPMHLESYGPINFNASIEGAYWVDVSYQGRSLGGESLTVEFRKPEEAQKQ